MKLMQWLGWEAFPCADEDDAEQFARRMHAMERRLQQLSDVVAVVRRFEPPDERLGPTGRTDRA